MHFPAGPRPTSLPQHATFAETGRPERKWQMDNMIVKLYFKIAHFGARWDILEKEC